MTKIVISSDKEKLNLDFIHGFLTRSYWAEGIPKHLVEKSIQHSLCFGAYKNQKQIGFARVITDYTHFAYLADVFIAPKQQRKGYGEILLNHIFSHQDLKYLRRWHLLTSDAQKLYQKFGFSYPDNAYRHMEKVSEPHF